MKSSIGKIVVGVLVLSSLSFIPTANASGGSVDSNFGTSGYFFSDNESNPGTAEQINDLSAQGEKLIVAGVRAGEFYIARLTSTGQPDNSFGGQDTSYLTLSAYSQADKIAVLNDGSFFVLGSFTSNTGYANSVILKFASNGTPYPSFNPIILNRTFHNDFYDYYPRDLILSPTQDSVYALLEGWNYDNPGFPYSNSVVYKFSTSGELNESFFENYYTGVGATDPSVIYSPQNPRSLAVFGNYVYVSGETTRESYGTFWTIGQIAKLNSSGARTQDFPGTNTNYSPSFTSANNVYSDISHPDYDVNRPNNPYSLSVTDMKTNSMGELFIVGTAYAPTWGGTQEETEFFIKKVTSLGNEDLSKVIFRENYSSTGYTPTLELYSDNKALLSISYSDQINARIFTRIFRFNSALTFDDFGIGGAIDLADTSLAQAVLLHTNQRIVSAGRFGDIADPKGFVSRSLSFDPPSSPTIGTATATGSTTASVTFTAPLDNGGSAITSYTISAWNNALDTVLKTQVFSTSLPSLGASATFTMTGLTASTLYRFSVAATNSEGDSSQSFATSAITTSSTSSGGTDGGGTGSGGTTTSTTAADELKRQQEAAAAAKQKQDQELKEILSLVPTIAGLAQGIAGLGNSLLLPKKCVKGKLVKNIKAGAKCPRGYKVRK
jgi:hypothetical protein